MGKVHKIDANDEKTKNIFYPENDTQTPAFIQKLDSTSTKEAKNTSQSRIQSISESRSEIA